MMKGLSLANPNPHTHLKPTQFLIPSINFHIDFTSNMPPRV